MTPDDIRAMMARLGLTQAQVARAVGVEQATVSRWLSGTHAPGDDLVARLRMLAGGAVPPAPPIVEVNTHGIARDLADRADLGTDPGEVARRDLERYYALLDRELRGLALTEGEAALLCDVSNGTLWEPSSMPLLWAEVEDALADGLAERWSVDGPALVAKLRALPLAARVAVCDATERFWRLPSVDDRPLADALRAVGLLR